jgi:hypothetical protein
LLNGWYSLLFAIVIYFQIGKMRKTGFMPTLRSARGFACQRILQWSKIIHLLNENRQNSAWKTGKNLLNLYCLLLS